jgi:hypothetical protein
VSPISSALPTVSLDVSPPQSASSSSKSESSSKETYIITGAILGFVVLMTAAAGLFYFFRLKESLIHKDEQKEISEWIDSDHKGINIVINHIYRGNSAYLDEQPSDENSEEENPMKDLSAIKTHI